ncbi:MAG: ribosomal-protein-alanine N-acetyltransferase RimI [Phormidesmis priestleyi]|uniref:Ribosomal-protein-alanine N-acetyltransferase RimI n=1 Tax=Phormidesmis priestleyi TaxID=268141 RepID=A0A2W4XPX5_9CYAN|nr:MAG: ribosomal-protein-alanine N-acetyltransferase RimI [Phormidesmis priestleyi]
MIEADLPAVLALDQRCLGGLWTRSGYQRELDSDCSDLLVLVSAPTAEGLRQRRNAFNSALPPASLAARFAASLVADFNADLAASDPTASTPASAIALLGTGCLWAILEEAHITTLAIEPAYQGQKLGQVLLSELLLCAYRRGLTRATLEVRAANEPALKLYQKFDFKEAGIRKRYYSDGENARILWRSGLQTEQAVDQIKQHQQAAFTALSDRYQPDFSQSSK